MLIGKAGLAALVGLLMLASPELGAQTRGTARDLVLELNKLEPLEKACRAYFLIKNQSKDEIEDIKLDIFIFGKDEVISRRFAISTGQLRPGKTVIRLFDIPDLECGTAARFLVNEVISCSSATGPIDRCGDRLAVTARSGVVFDY